MAYGVFDSSIIAIMRRFAGRAVVSGSLGVLALGSASGQHQSPRPESPVASFMLRYVQM